MNGQDILSEILPLAKVLEGEVKSWRDQGYQGATQTTATLLNYWFNRDITSQERFYPCQQRAIETVIYCHEILGITSLRDMYYKLCPEVLAARQRVKEEVENTLFSKYCLKMATGSGKTWVLQALIVWQYFNFINREKPGKYTNNFIIVTPGKEVLNRILDAFKGKQDPITGVRNPSTRDLEMSLFMPQTQEWKGRFNLLEKILEPEDIKLNMNLPEDGFIYITNWQQFRLKERQNSVYDRTIGNIEEPLRGEIILNFLENYNNLIIMNDEAHHVHGQPNQDNEYLVWREFINRLYEKLEEKYRDKKLFLQIDFSATPFYGSRENRKYFPHIVYDYPLISAINDMLVKQLFLEERQSVNQELERLDFRAEREGGRRGKVIGLSYGQKMMIEIGRLKLEQLHKEFKEKKIDKKPVMMILCEETEVAYLVYNYILSLPSNLTGQNYQRKEVMVIYSGMEEEKFGYTEEEAQKMLYKVDDNNDPLKIVISVLKLREGFDRKNISVIVVLRAAEADLLLEQIVGRGLRLMFPQEEYPQFWEEKKEAVNAIKANQIPQSSLDFLFIVEHPRFRQFYEELRNEGYNIGSGDTERVRSTGSIIPVEVIPQRIKDYDLYWPQQIFEQSKTIDFSQINISSLPKYNIDFNALKTQLRNVLIGDRHLPTEKIAKVWKLKNEFFDYNLFLSEISKAIATEGKEQLLTGYLSEIAKIVDEYVSKYLFGQEIDFTQKENYCVLNWVEIWDFVKREVRNKIVALLGEPKYVYTGKWRHLSEVERIYLRDNYKVEVKKCIYSFIGFSIVGGGFEKKFIENVLETSPEVLSFCKLQRTHPLRIPYRDETGIQREYEIDFIVKTQDCMYLVETKSDRDLELEITGLKAKAASVWCINASQVSVPSEINQPQKWEYLLIGESLFNANPYGSFSMFITEGKFLAQSVIRRFEEKIF